jgi:hypothetical protein
MRAGINTIDFVESQLVEHADRLGRSMAGFLALVALFDRYEGARRSGFRSLADWLSWRCAIGRRAAREQVRVARRLADLPLVREAFTAGELSYSKVRALTRTAASQNEAALLDLARASTAVQLERAVASLRSADSADVAAANAAHERRGLNWWWNHDGTLNVIAQLGADEGAALVETVESGAEMLHPDLPRPGLSARRADALMEIVLSGAPPAQVVLHVDAEALACTATSPGERAGEVCALEDGPAIPSETARRLGCDAEIIVARHHADGSVDHGRRRRVVSPALRTALERRDRGCRFPGCTRRHGIHAHHIDHWAHGGATDRDNLVLLCRFHQRLVHEDGFTITRGDDLVFHRPDGRRLALPPPGR